MVSEAEAVGLIAGLFIATSFIPQIVRVWRLKDARDISLAFNILNLSGAVLWLAYGLLLGLFSVILWNATNTVLASLLLAVKLKYGMEPNRPPLRASSLVPSQ